MSQFVTIRRWALKDGAAEDELVALVRDRLIPAYREQPGCLELELLRTSDRGSYLAITHWETRAAFESWSGPGGEAWRRRNTPMLERWLDMMAFQAEWDAEEIASS